MIKLESDKTMLLCVIITALSVYGTDALNVCLHCSNITAPTNCSQVTKCGPLQSCFTEMFLTSNGEKRYNLGCRDTEQCDAPEEVSQDTNTASMCTECCTGDLCAGCQFKGYPSPRGPICYDCGSRPNNSEIQCSTVKVCAEDEACMLQKPLKRLKDGHFEYQLLQKCKRAHD
ncbi:uncharacterized protein LOC132726329 [Ruditapes philippinarum]|uniref:uncharacterized protein LOC132726329 n=1 Tax=Ruditapes philippinarum TaxID=129788 RepID=UPI00295AB7E0|nr:uncharacterized protein LOC132726329 [Ruditapes philippinarum]